MKLVTENSELLKSGIGIGAIDAVFKTIDSMVAEEYELKDYTVKSVTGGTDSFAGVTVKLGCSDGTVYTGNSSDLDIVTASAKAYLKAINKLAYFHTRSKRNNLVED